MTDDNRTIRHRSFVIGLGTIVLLPAGAQAIPTMRLSCYTCRVKSTDYSDQASTIDMAHAPSAMRLTFARTFSLLNISRGLHRYSLLAGLLIAFVGLVTLVAPTDPDVWWHLTNGNLILSSGVPTHDVYSYTASGRPWFVQEWLTEVMMYGLKTVFGYGALSLFFGLLQALGALIVYRLLRHRGAGRITSLVLLMAYFVFGAPTWGVRPQVLSAVFIGAFYLVLTLYKADTSRVRLLWLLPLLTALWVNMHASYFIGIALIGAFAVGEMANNFLYRPDEPFPVRPLFATVAACLIATLANPYFIELWSYPLTYMLHGTSNPLLRYTQEWQSPDFHDPVNLVFGLSLVLLAFVGITRPVQAVSRQEWRQGLLRRLDVSHAIILAAFTVLALQAVRLVPLYGVIALPLFAGGLAGMWPALSDNNETPPNRVEGRVNWFIAPLGVALIAILLVSATPAQTGLEPRTDTQFKYPAGGAEYIEGLLQPVNMYNDFAWGGYLIYKLYPQHKVFIDGRADMYREGIFDDFITVQNVSPGWREVLDRYDVNLVILQHGTPLGYALDHDAGWKIGYKDGVSVVYKK